MKFVFRLAGAALVLAVAGCSSAPGGGQHRVAEAAGDHPLVQASSAASAGATASGPDVLLEKYGPAPLSAFDFTAGDYVTQQHAEDVLVAACMRSHGFASYQLPQENPPNPRAHDWDEFLGATDATWVAKHGYALPQTAPMGSAVAPTLPATPSPRDVAYYTTLWGPDYLTTGEDDPHACLPSIQAALTSHRPMGDRDLVTKLREQAVTQAGAAKRVQRDLTAWRTCMKTHGYSVASPPALQQKPGDVAQAVTDVACKSTSHLTDDYVEALYAAEKSSAQAHEDDLSVYADWSHDNTRLAADALRKAGDTSAGS